MVDIPGATKNGVQDYAKTLGIKAGHTVQEVGWDDDCDSAISEAVEDAMMSSSCGGVTMTVTSLMNLSTPYAPSPTTGVSGYFRPPLAPKVNLLQAWYLNPHSSPA